LRFRVEGVGPNETLVLHRVAMLVPAGFGVWGVDFCITQLKAQGPSRTCNESKEEEEGVWGVGCGPPRSSRGTRLCSGRTPAIYRIASTFLV